jgi:hypothetical protein
MKLNGIFAVAAVCVASVLLYSVPSEAAQYVKCADTQGRVSEFKGTICPTGWRRISVTHHNGQQSGKQTVRCMNYSTSQIKEYAGHMCPFGWKKAG